MSPWKMETTMATLANLWSKITAWIFTTAESRALETLKRNPSDHLRHDIGQKTYAGDDTRLSWNDLIEREGR